MSTDPFAAASAPLDAAAEEYRPQAASWPQDFAELAAALQRIEALLAGVVEGPDGSAAIERIADIAFVLHERDVEPSLCDALDDAVRELGGADALKRASAERVRGAAALLRNLSLSLSEMAARAEVEQEPQAIASVSAAGLSSNNAQVAPDSGHAEAAPEHDPSPPAGLLDAEMPEADTFAVTETALAEAQPGESGVASADVRYEMAEPVASSLTRSEYTADEETVETFQPVTAPEDDLRAEIAPARFEADENLAVQTAAHAIADHDQAPPVADLIEGETVDGVAPIVARDEAQAHEPRAERSQAAPEPAAPQSAIDPSEDPGDLFESAADALPPSMPMPIGPAAVGMPRNNSGAADAASVPLAPLPIAAAATMVAAKAPPSDPLAPIRALSEEEMIALFS